MSLTEGTNLAFRLPPRAGVTFQWSGYYPASVPNGRVTWQWADNVGIVGLFTWHESAISARLNGYGILGPRGQRSGLIMLNDHIPDD